MMELRRTSLPRRVRARTAGLAALTATLALGAPGAALAEEIAFEKEPIADTKDLPGFLAPTSMAFGPDGRLYVSVYKAASSDASSRGEIHVFEEEQPSDEWSRVRVIDTIAKRPNFDRDGDPNLGIVGRQVVGIAFAPNPDASGNPILYVSHSDPRFGLNKKPGDLLTDTSSGAVTRLVGPDFNEASATDLVVGLPRSGENHAPNGMSIDPDGWITLGIGGNTNQGGVSSTFSFVPEVPLSASIVKINAEAIAADGTPPIDASPGSSFSWTAECKFMKNLVASRDPATNLTKYFQDGDGDGQQDAGEPTECSSEHNWSPGTPASPRTGKVPGRFEIVATGLRNPYDLAWHSNERLYVNDNEGNGGAGTTPGLADGGCAGPPSDVGTKPDELFLVEQDGYYGHPNPSRGECQRNGGTGLGGQPFAPPLHEYTTGRSTNGIVEYTAGNFGGALKGQLLTVNYSVGENLARVKLSPNGTVVEEEKVVVSGLTAPLDVTTRPDGRVFVAEVVDPSKGIGRILMLTPLEKACENPADPDDVDGDGFMNNDEIANGIAACSVGVEPPDADGDLVSDLNDEDDDNDGVPDTADQLQRDATNGKATPDPFELDFLNSNSGGFFGTGFAGVQLSSKGGGPLELDPPITTGIGSGVMQLYVTPGDAEGARNDQNNALQQGFFPDGPFRVRARLEGGFSGGGEKVGVFLGPGEDDFVRMLLRKTNGGALAELGLERGGIYTPIATVQLDAVPESVDLILEGDPAARTITAGYSLSGDDERTLGGVDVPAAWFGGGGGPALAGLFGTSGAGGPVEPLFVFARKGFEISSGARLPASPGGTSPSGPAPGGTSPSGPGAGGPSSSGPAGDQSQAGAAAPSAGAAVCAPVPARRESEDDVIRVTRQAMVIQQRIDAAALRRLNAVNAWLDAGILPSDLCAGAFGPAAFQAGIPWVGGAGPAILLAPSPRALSVKKAATKRARFTLSAGQAKINDRISRALFARAVATWKRINALTGGNLAPRASLAGRPLYPGLGIAGALPASEEAPPRTLQIARPPAAGKITLTARQLRITQRRSQRAIILANRVQDRIRAGLTEEQFEPGSIGAGRLG